MIALSIPLTLAIVFSVMEMTRIDLQRISLGALIIALGLLVDDAMTTVDVMTSRLAAGYSKEDAATFAYKTLAMPMLMTIAPGNCLKSVAWRNRLSCAKCCSTPEGRRNRIVLSKLLVW